MTTPIDVTASPTMEPTLDELSIALDGAVHGIALRPDFATNILARLCAHADQAGDARRYQHIQLHGFPTRNQTDDRDRRWVAFSGGREFYGATPSFAIDAAISAGKGGDHG